jgi:hypothetical protein
MQEKGPAGGGGAWGFFLLDAGGRGTLPQQDNSAHGGFVPLSMSKTRRGSKTCFLTDGFQNQRGSVIAGTRPIGNNAERTQLCIYKSSR